MMNDLPSPDRGLSATRSELPADLDPERLRDMLRTMIMIRQFDQRALELYREGVMRGTTHPYIGMEAVAVGACAALALPLCGAESAFACLVTLVWFVWVFRWHPRFVIGASGVAPVRGGTYFLCRRKESKQRKRANTARS